MAHLNLTVSPVVCVCACVAQLSTPKKTTSNINKLKAYIHIYIGNLRLLCRPSRSFFLFFQPSYKIQSIIYSASLSPSLLPSQKKSASSPYFSPLPSSLPSFFPRQKAKIRTRSYDKTWRLKNKTETAT